MPAFEKIHVLLTEPAAQALGYALLHALWQGALVALLLWGMLKLVGDRPSVRYVVSCAALALMIILPGLTWLFLVDTADPSVLPAATLEDLTTRAPVSVSEAGVGEPSAAWRPAAAIGLYLPYLILGWAAGVLVLLVRLLGGWGYARYQIGHTGTQAPAPWQAQLDELAARLRIARRVRLLLTENPASPYVFGWLRPIIVLPASMLTALPPWQIEAILAHELAHVRRHDFLVSLLQSVAETVLFYHPAVWWVSRQIRTEREHCCDDLAVAACGSVTVYARALLAVEEFRQATVPLALAASGSSLLNRIHRLVAPAPAPHQIHASSRTAFALAGLVLTSVLFVACADLVMRGYHSTVQRMRRR